MNDEDRGVIADLRSKLSNIEYQIEQRTKVDLPSIAYIVLGVVAVHFVLRLVGLV